MLLRLLLALSLTLPAPVLFAAPADQRELELGVSGDLEIDRDGSVREFNVTSRLTPALQRVVENHVRDWAFEPIAVDGTAVIAKTAMRLRLRALPAGDDYRLQVENVSFGEARPGQTTPPRYPVAAVREGIGAKVLLQVRIDRDGRVIAVHPYQTSLSGAKLSEGKASLWRERFERVSVEAASAWIYEPSETLDGRSEEQTALVPIVFTLSDSPNTGSIEGRWSEYTPGPRSPAPWLDASSTAAATETDADAIGQGESRSLSTRFRLKDDIAGSVL